MEIYLTRIILNPQSRHVWNDIGNPQQLHRTISNAFPKIEGQEHLPHHERKTPRSEFNLLHRLDFNARNGKAVLLVQSSARPDWRFLSEDYASENVCKAVHDKYEKIENGMRLLFRLHANPTKRIGRSDTEAKPKFKEFEKGGIRRRVELRTDDEKIKWLERKGEEAGFRLGRVAIAPNVSNVATVRESKIKGWRNKADKPMTFGSVVFEGILEVTDAKKLKTGLQNGIGTGKAYGFGLLSIAPIRA